MEKYSVISVIGEGSYGKVMKCRHNESGLIVAIKKFTGTDEDFTARKVAFREIRMLKKLHNPHLVSLLEVFRRKKRSYLVFEYMPANLLDKMDAEGPLPSELVRRYFYQIVKGVQYCHDHNIIHRDIKPENILISDLGIVKICDFGFARFATTTKDPFTDYVATRWYRAPELLVGDVNYGRAVDIWALGCIIIEMLTNKPLFAGYSDIDQLYQITNLLGSLCSKQHTLMSKVTEELKFSDASKETIEIIENIKGKTSEDPVYNMQEKFPSLSKKTTELACACLSMDPAERIECEDILKHKYFTGDRFFIWFIPELEKKISLDAARKVQVSEVPYPPLDTTALSSLLGPRRPTKLKSEWSLDLIQDSPLKDCPLFADGRKLRFKQSLTGESDKEDDKTSSQEKFSIRSSEESNLSIEQMDEHFPAGKEGELDMPKIKMEYKRNMMPECFHIKPYRGRLQFNREHCNTVEPQRSQHEEVCLPQIRDLNRFIQKKADFFGMTISKEMTNQEKRPEQQKDLDFSEKKNRGYSQLKKRKPSLLDAVVQKAQLRREENICLCEEERRIPEGR
ncbi:cyclin-dependent kinase-like 1 isoform X2 [Halyomorpha halys]|uniref:cyclin-dependent kinase-like 1 isoform X2 n=1 Tax=Halyomorpha halys TaxID=286706 RepID=UPI0006D4D168|nr:cyclin-dependent kinase-like 1 isoform X2 [Halyomorpha halys]